MSKKLTVKEMVAMRGTEFTYIMSDGDSVRGFVKEFDPKKGLSCYSLETKTKEGYCPADSIFTDVDDDGTWCLISIKKEVEGKDFLKEVRIRLEPIHATGVYDTRKTDQKSSGFGFSPICAFS